ncbi:LPS export ABC transporter permease LptG [Ottowia testudinis]|uniref:LPS export ABC transporter permease LptG n=1 Tax=Ottowia testudinis TaxID=2816950 RepID=A0A975CCC8_9BURK|nr:LPS export ABC transporter permease LptG [Ottowia testudinis]QTD43790.1 LPS export ABC transporter permease LptG [Ottowia testudinis]
MKTIRRLVYSEVLRAVGFVTLAFLALFFFFDLVDALGDVRDGAARGYTVAYGLLVVALQVPNHLYELMPIAVLIGTIFVMARLAASSEFTILRTSGLGPLRALGTLMLLGAGFVVVTFVFGDYVAPAASRAAQTLQARFMGDITVGRTGAWLKDRANTRTYSVNVGALSSDGTLNHVRIYEFNAEDGHLVSTTKADRGRIVAGGWKLEGVDRRSFEQAGSQAPLRMRVTRQEQWQWPTDLSLDTVAAALLSPDRMQTLDLFQYIRHLQANGQSAQRYEIEFWRKVFYPLSCLVMMVLALPFAYLHFRAGNITGYVFIGVLVGISFFLLNNVFGHIGNLRDWEPWLAAASPGFIYSLLSLALFGWLVLRQ